MVLQKQPFSQYDVVQVLTYPHAERATGASYRGTMTQCIGCKRAMVGECTSNTPTIFFQRSLLFTLHISGGHLRDSMV